MKPLQSGVVVDDVDVPIFTGGGLNTLHIKTVGLTDKKTFTPRNVYFLMQSMTLTEISYLMMTVRRT